MSIKGEGGLFGREADQQGWGMQESGGTAPSWEEEPAGALALEPLPLLRDCRPLLPEMPQGGWGKPAG